MQLLQPPSYLIQELSGLNLEHATRTNLKGTMLEEKKGKKTKRKEKKGIKR